MWSWIKELVLHYTTTPFFLSLFLKSRFSECQRYYHIDMFQTFKNLREKEVRDIETAREVWRWKSHNANINMQQNRFFFGDHPCVFKAMSFS